MTDARVCQHCGAGIDGKRSDARFCCGRCYFKNYNLGRKEEQLARLAEWVKKNPKAKYRWRTKNAEKLLRYSREWRARNIEDQRARERANYRKRIAAQHMQDAFAATPVIMSLLAEMENSNDQ